MTPGPPNKGEYPDFLKKLQQGKYYWIVLEDSTKVPNFPKFQTESAKNVSEKSLEWFYFVRSVVRNQTLCKS